MVIITICFIQHIVYTHYRHVNLRSYTDSVNMYTICVGICVWICCRWNSSIQRPLFKCQSGLSLERHRGPSLFPLPFSHPAPCTPHSGQINYLLLFSLFNPLYLWLVYSSILTFRTKELAVRRKLIMFLWVPTYLVLLNVKCCFCPSLLFHVCCINMSTSFNISIVHWYKYEVHHFIDTIRVRKLS